MDIQHNSKESLINLAKRAVNQANLNNCIIHISFAETTTVVKQNDDPLEVLKHLKIKEMKQTLSRITLRLKEAQA